MSIENHPNVNAVKLMMDTHKVLMECLRGTADIKRKELEFTLLNKARKFAEDISEFLDEAVTDGKST